MIRIERELALRTSHIIDTYCRAKRCLRLLVRKMITMMIVVSQSLLNSRVPLVSWLVDDSFRILFLLYVSGMKKDKHATARRGLIYTYGMNAYSCSVQFFLTFIVEKRIASRNRCELSLTISHLILGTQLTIM